MGFRKNKGTMLKIALTLHTEKLDADNVWYQVEGMLSFLQKRHIPASFFCTAPTHAYYRNQPYFSETKWINRINQLAQQGHSIQQHTHFYAPDGTKTGDFTLMNVEKRLTEDYEWLQRQKFTPTGFVGGGWTINLDIVRFLARYNYRYDCSARTFSLDYLKDRDQALQIQQPCLFNFQDYALLELPTSTSVATFMKSLYPFSGAKIYVDVPHSEPYALIYLHDYDLLNPKFRIALRVALSWYYRRGCKFLTTDELADIVSRGELSYQVLDDSRC